MLMRAKRGSRTIPRISSGLRRPSIGSSGTGHSAAEVVRRIRALFKEAAPVKARLDMNQIIAEVLRVLSDELRDNSIVVETELAADLPRIAGDHVQIQQTLINLIHNATEAMAVCTVARSRSCSSHGAGRQIS